MKQYFDFNGTAKRQEYWAVTLLSFLALIFSLVILEGNEVSALVALVALIGSLWAILATTSRRLRDADLNLWWIVLIFVPYVGTIATIVFGVIASKE